MHLELLLLKEFFTYRTVIYYLAVCCWGCLCYGLLCGVGNLSNISPRCKVGYFLCTEYIFIELATTFALVVCFLTALCAGGSFRSNQSQIVSVRYSFVISAGVANIVRTVIVSRFGCCSIAASTFMPVTCAVAGPSGTPIVTGSCDIVNSLGLCICPSFSSCIGCFALCCAGLVCALVTVAVAVFL